MLPVTQKRTPRKWLRVGGRGPVAVGRRRPWWRRVLRVFAIMATAALVSWLVVAWMQQLPRVEPPFERIVGSGAGPIKEFELPGNDGRTHTLAEWNGRPAIVLAFLSTECPVTRDRLPALDEMARRFAARGVLVLGVNPTTGIDADEMSRRWTGRKTSFPILFDGRRRVTRQAGVAVTPEAAVLLPDGQVVYRGRVRSALEDALESILAGVLPDVAVARAEGTPLPPISAADDRPEPVTFNKDVAPILWNNCARCHRPGDVGPFPLLRYRDAAKRASDLIDVVESGQMPPWKAHPGAGVFLDTPRMTVLEKETLARWVEAGCPEGSPDDLPPMPRFPEGWALGPPDFVLTMPEAWEVTPSRYDTYRAFAVPSPKDRDVTITGIEFHPGNPRIVHHSRIHVNATGDARRREDADPTPGFAGWMGRTIVELPYPGLGGWTPGLTPRHAPEGSGRFIRKGSEIVMQIHYHPTGKVESDRSSVGLYFAKQPLTRRMAGVSISTDRIDIPAGAKRHVLIQAARVKADVRLYTVVPHAHYLCREFRLAATLPDGTVRPLLWINDWDFDWQDQYRYALPVRLPKDTILTFAAYFDNSEENPRNPNRPPQRVRYGIESHDEMCACHLEFLPENPSGYAEYPGKSPFGM